jgi:aminoglycoside 6-adenylyltransferase
MSELPSDGNVRYSYLMQFMDGNRIDLSFYPPQFWSRPLDDSLCVALLDKDGLLENLPPASDQDYRPKPPTEKAFQDCCNEFWWVSPYVAKGLWRGEMIYAKTMLEDVLRKQLMKILNWHYGFQTDFKSSPGKLGKNFKYVFAAGILERIERTYSDGDIERTWESLFAMGDLFRELAQHVAEKAGFAYPGQDDQRVNAYLRHIRSLPKEATTIY